VIKSTRILVITSLAMIAFASNSLLCRAALKQNDIDAASFTFARIFSGAIALWLLVCVRRKASADRTPAVLTGISFISALLSQRPLVRDGSWPSALALFVYAAAFAFAYLALSAGTGALLLFGAVQATMILWGLHKGERLSVIQSVGVIVAVTGLVVLVFPGLSAPPLAGSILMLAAGVAWGVYSLRGKCHGRKFCPRSSVRDCSHRHFRSMDACRSCGNRLRHNIGRGYIRSRLCRLV
jgi:drug/metabolite transporter (DMT)-like permease